MNEKDVSIIIPIHNGEKYIDKCLRYIVDNITIDYEIIAINDHSVDMTQKILDDFSRGYANIFSYKSEKSGVSAARNLGIKYSSGKYIIFIDIDDIFKVELLNEYYKHIYESHDDICIWGYSKVEVNGDQELHLFEQKFSMGNTEFLKTQFIGFFEEKLIQAPWNKLFRRSFLLENNIYFDETLSILEDVVFCCEAFSKAERIEYLPIIGNLYIQHLGSAVRRYHECHVSGCFKFREKLIEWGHCAGYDEIQKYVEIKCKYMLYDCTIRVFENKKIRSFGKIKAIITAYLNSEIDKGNNPKIFLLWNKKLFHIYYLLLGARYLIKRIIHN